MAQCQQNLGISGAYRQCELQSRFVISLAYDIQVSWFWSANIYSGLCSDMSFNKLSGGIPRELGQLQNIVSL